MSKMRSILITGSRSGIGLEMVKQLLNHPTAKPEYLIATCRKIQDAPELQELAAKNPNLHILEIDLTNFDKYEEVVTKVRSIVGDKGLNVLFHNAGLIGPKEPSINSVKLDDLMNQFKVNTVAPIMLTKALLPLLREAAKVNASKPVGVDKSAIVLMSSVLGSVSANTSGGYWGYRETKAAANQALRSMKAEFGKEGIATLVLHPGWVKTKMGGDRAPLTPEQSVGGLLPQILNLSKDTDGSFVQWDGKKVEW